MLVICLAAPACGLAAETGADPDAVKEVLAGKRREANAAWWGFSEQDATDALQAAIRSGAAKLTVPDMGKPWRVRPLFLESDQEIVFEKGVVAQAVSGAFRGTGDSLFLADNRHNITLRGYGAEWAMRKEDYQKPPYPKAEWRMALSLRSCRNVKVYGLRISRSGGDGIYVGRSDQKGAPAGCEDVHIKDVVCAGHHRQGISVICARNLLIEDCAFQDTDGTAPEAGIDFEPNRKDEYLTRCAVRNCTFTGNSGYGILFALHLIGDNPVSICVENCTSDRNKAGPLRIAAPSARGHIELLGNKLNGKQRIEHGTGLMVESGPAPKAEK
ncbi:MAG: right-handed parallel beta-helix repeat-containing protein [Planctomycetota bacterium]|nr:right-handed parallel beta-helix repeat-containing protein [Planctomycetota bacterium]